MRALWIEDHQLIGDSLEVLFHVLMPELSLDKAKDADAAVELARSFKYQVVLMDWWIGQQGGALTLDALRRAGCQAPVIVVTADDRDATAQQAAALGVAALVTKNADPRSLISTIRDVLNGHTTVTRAPKGGADSPSLPPLPTLDVGSVYPELTQRQADVFRCLMKGHSDKQIARILDVAETTVKTHVRAILQIVGASKRGEAVYQARSRGVIEH
jgi:two-component system, NarL family, nitrate/nitrite response regulator NarL